MEWTAFLFAGIGSVLFLSLIFATAVNRNRYDVIDIAWGLTFISIAYISYMTYVPVVAFSVQLLVILLVTVWGIRLSAHIYARWVSSDKEDARYTAYRQTYSKKVGGLKLNMYLRIFLVQAVLAVIVALPVITINAVPVVALTYVSLIGLVIWAVGFYFEAIGDYQLKKFIANPKNKGKLMTSGVWRYTRHPNYFGEITQWWGIFVIVVFAVPTYWWIAVIGPVTITLLLMFISGVPLTEKHFASKPGWEVYKKRTSKLIPLPRRRE
ncbi:DUF1295 domain-containing protein [Candidatus Saccharibacteria bacterium]|nr:DUF1295 domain-containing protein [Candidatus Saccharibacteria bacterium]